jgi:hypothetical protein
VNDLIKQAGETHLKALAPAFPTAWENVNFKPPVGPFQVPTWLFADPDDRGGADAPYLQRGIFTITLAYPTNQGGGAAEAKAKEIRQHFKKATTIVTTGGFNVIVEKEPEITGGRIEGDRYIVRVLIRFYAWISRD